MAKTSTWQLPNSHATVKTISSLHIAGNGLGKESRVHLPPSPSYPCITLVETMPMQAHSMAEALHQAWRKHGSESVWKCLILGAGQPLPRDTAIYLLGRDWRCNNPDSAMQHHHWRELLHAEARDYVVLYGDTAQQWHQLTRSLRSLAPALDWAWLPHEPVCQTARLRPYGCEQCSDPDCERRLFDALRSGRD